MVPSLEVLPVITALSNTTFPPQDKFLAMLPLIRQEARVAFCGVRPDLREELTAEVVANSYCAYSRLADRGKRDESLIPRPSWGSTPLMGEHGGEHGGSMGPSS
jgi:hypothetical protein